MVYKQKLRYLSTRSVGIYKEFDIVPEKFLRDVVFKSA